MLLEFNCLIKKWREESGYTLEELAKLTHTTAQSISLYENGKRNVGYDTLKLFASALHKQIEIKETDEGVIPLTDTQRRKIRAICTDTCSTKELYEKLKKLFDIKEEEMKAGKLFDDMDMFEYIKNSPSELAYRGNGQWHYPNIHSEEVTLYYRCMGGEYTKDEFRSSCTMPSGVKEFTPPRRTSEDGFITEQRRELLKIVKECIEIYDETSAKFDYRTLQRKIGF